MNRLRTTPLNYVLSSVVMAWGMLPPAVLHTHEGGDQVGHRHTVAAHETHAHHHHDGAHLVEHSHQHAGTASLQGLAGIVAHIHWGLLGIEFSWPLPEDSNHDSNGSEVELTLVRLADEVAPPTMVNNATDRAIGDPVLQPALDVVRPVNTSSHPPNLISAIPLCDSARFERSGVLLA